MSTYNSFTLNEEETISAEINYWVSSPSIEAVYKVETLQSLDIEVKYKLLDNALTCTIYGTDLLKTTSFSAEFTPINGIITAFNIYGDRRSVKISLSYNFGKSLHIQKRKSRNASEKTDYEKFKLKEQTNK